MSEPLVSCLFYPGQDALPAIRALQCYQRQSWSNRELVLADDGSELPPPVDRFLTGSMPDSKIRRISITADHTRTTHGWVHEAAIQAAGSSLVLWETDTWHHPERIRMQLKYLLEGYDACWMQSVLLHLDHPEYVHHPYKYNLRDGHPESLMIRSRYADCFTPGRKNMLRLALDKLDGDKTAIMDESFSWLAVRTLRGPAESASHKLFRSGFRKGRGNLARWAWVKIRGRSDLMHPRFRLNPQERKSFHLYMFESQELGMLQSLD